MPEKGLSGPFWLKPTLRYRLPTKFPLSVLETGPLKSRAEFQSFSTQVIIRMSPGWWFLTRQRKNSLEHCLKVWILALCPPVNTGLERKPDAVGLERTDGRVFARFGLVCFHFPGSLDDRWRCCLLEQITSSYGLPSTAAVISGYFFNTNLILERN